MRARGKEDHRAGGEDLPLLLPKGWDFETLLGEAAPMPSPSAPLPEQNRTMELPQTATGFLGSIYCGLAAFAAGLFGLIGMRAARRRKGRLA